MKNVKNRSTFYDKMAYFAIILPWMANHGSERIFLLIFSARDDPVKVSWKSNAQKCQNQLTPTYLDQLPAKISESKTFSICNNYADRCLSSSHGLSRGEVNWFPWNWKNINKKKSNFQPPPTLSSRHIGCCSLSKGRSQKIKMEI